MRTFLLAATAWLTLAESSFAQSGTWQWTRSVDQMTDEVRYMAYTRGENRVAAFICEPGEGFRTVRVNNRMLDIELGGQRDVVWRVDQAPAREASWYNIDDGGAITTGPEAIEFADAVRKAQDRLVIRSGGVTARYSVAGSTAAIDAVFEACGIATPAE